MLIPAKVDCVPVKRRPRERMRYVFQEMALSFQCDSMRALAACVGLDHTTIHYCIKNGRCSPRVALILTEKCGDLFGTAHQLCNPMLFETEKPV